MKTKALMICAVALFCFLNANAQDPFKDLTKNDAVVTVKTPSIINFVTAFLSEPEDELRGSIAPEWDKYLNNKPLGKGVTLLVDQKNGYVRYELDYDVAYPDDPTGLKSYVEYCYWNCADAAHKLFAENVGMTENGEPVFAQFEGLYIYAYDNATQKLYMIDQESIGLGDDTRGEVTFALPRKGKDIEMCIIKGTKKIQKKLVWNGKGFNLK